VGKHENGIRNTKDSQNKQKWKEKEAIGNELID
jgi:hypothetical protein